MKHPDFAIGTTFFTATGQWRCTDVGRRVIVAIPVTPGREEGRWGPPYAVQEVVFAENDLEGCSLAPLNDIEAPAAAYDADLCRWLAAQLTYLRQGQFDRLEPKPLADELEEHLAKSRRAPEAWMRKLFRALYRPTYRYGDWNRLHFCWDMLAGALKDSPSLQAKFADDLDDTFESAKCLAALDNEDQNWPETNPIRSLADLEQAVEARCEAFAQREQQGIVF